MTTDEKKRLDQIIDEASKLPTEKQEYILSVIRGMLFSGKYHKQKNNKKIYEDS